MSGKPYRRISHTVYLYARIYSFLRIIKEGELVFVTCVDRCSCFAAGLGRWCERDDGKRSTSLDSTPEAPHPKP